ncbi:MAG TPA: hypothetical protein VGG40_04600 [Solirubrobacterales bacterium]
MSRGIALALAVICAAAVALATVAGTASAAAPAPLAAAREALELTDARLELMDEVMASKWFSRTPIQDPAQEAAVKEAAVAKAQALGVAAGGTRSLFAAEIAAAKEVELGWGARWLYYGAPPDLAAPELEALRSQLSEISERIVAVLPRLLTLGRLPAARRRVGTIAGQVLRVRYLGGESRARIVDSLLAIRPAAPGHGSP